MPVSFSSSSDAASINTSGVYFSLPSLRDIQHSTQHTSCLLSRVTAGTLPFLSTATFTHPRHHRHRISRLNCVLIEFSRMTLLKRYVLRLFISLKYITANVVDRNNGRIVATASTVEHSLKNSLECGRSCNAKAAAVVGEVLAMRLKVDGLEQGQGRGIHVDMEREIEKKGLKNSTKIWSIVNALKNNGVKLVLEDDEKKASCSSYRVQGAYDFRNSRD